MCIHKSNSENAVMWTCRWIGQGRKNKCNSVVIPEDPIGMPPLASLHLQEFTCNELGL